MKAQKTKKKISLFTWILVGFIAGIVLGIVAPEFGQQLKFLGTILTNLLNMVVVPLVMCLLITAAADVGDIKKLGKRAGRTFLIFMVTTALAIVVGLVLAHAFNVGKGITIDLNGLTADSSKQMNILDTIIGIIPTNISGGLMAKGHPLGATGVAQICELVWQIRGEAGLRQVENAKIGLAHCRGGTVVGTEGGACTVQIVKR